MDRYSKLNQYISTGSLAEAEELFRSIVLDEARKIYEGMESLEDLDDNEDWIGGDASDDLIADVSAVEDGRNMEESDENTTKDDSSKSGQLKAHVVPNAAKLVPAPKPNNSQAEKVNNLTPFPKTS